MNLITESITENNQTKIVSQYMHEQIYDLAKDIASFPQNHDELEILIADRIKRFLHQEKLSVYSKIKMYFSEPSQYQSLMKFLDDKIKVHSDLSSKWEYGSKHSCADQIREK